MTDLLGSQPGTAVAVVQDLTIALRAVRSDRPSAHTDRVWKQILDAVHQGEQFLAAAPVAHTYAGPVRSMSTHLIVSAWRPGSGDTDDWDWVNETGHLCADPTHATKVRRWVTETPAHDDPYPIIAGSDGRIWDGHHRIIGSLIAGRSHLPVVWDDEYLSDLFAERL